MIKISAGLLCLVVAGVRNGACPASRTATMRPNQSPKTGTGAEDLMVI